MRQPHNNIASFNDIVLRVQLLALISQIINKTSYNIRAEHY